MQQGYDDSEDRVHSQGHSGNREDIQGRRAEGLRMEAKCMICGDPTDGYYRCSVENEIRIKTFKTVTICPDCLISQLSCPIKGVLEQKLRVF